MMEINVLHISTNDFTGGGAGKAALRLHNAMLECGIKSRMLVLNKQTSYASVAALGSSKITRYMMIINILIDKIKLFKYHPYASFSVASSGFHIKKHKLLKEADIIYLHWVNHGFLSIKEIAEILSLGKPVFWFFHDMWPITGGCHHSFDCVKYMDSCNACPALQRHSSENDISRKVFQYKLKLWSQYNNLHIITPSNWLAKCAQSSRLFGNGRLSINVIPNTFDPQIFIPKETTYCREYFSLTKSKKLILFGAHMAVSNPYKGWNYMHKALQNLKLREDIVAVILGSKVNKDIIDSIPIPVVCIEPISDESSLSMLYSAVDVFVTPSLADNFPNTIVESMACGTPVVGFNVGGIPDLIKHKVTGYLAEYKNANDLSAGIEWVLSKHKSDFNTRSFIMDTLSPEVVVKQHKSIWEKQ